MILVVEHSELMLREGGGSAKKTLVAVGKGGR